MNVRKRLALTAVSMISLGVVVVAAAPAGSAQFSGANGVIQYSQVDGQAQTASVHIVKPDGTGNRTIVASGWWASQNATATRLSYVTMTGFGSSTPNQLRVANFDGTGDTLVDAAPANHSYSSTSMSPDGAKILFIDRVSNGATSDLILINADGTGRTNLTNGALTGVNWPQFSPNGSTISFSAQASSVQQVFTMPAAGGAATQITTGGTLTRSASWTPDGKLLAMSNNSIVRMNADGTNQTTILTAASINMTNVDWPVASPDGTKFSFSAAVAPNPYSLWVANIDGSNPVKILDAATLGSTVDAALAVWSSGDGTVTTTTTIPADPVVPTFTG